MVNWKGFGRKRAWHILRYYPDIRLDGLSKNTRDIVRIAGHRAEIRTCNLSNTKQDC
jgi:hypothetical protein